MYVYMRNQSGKVGPKVLADLARLLKYKIKGLNSNLIRLISSRKIWILVHYSKINQECKAKRTKMWKDYGEVKIKIKIYKIMQWKKKKVGCPHTKI